MAGRRNFSGRPRGTGPRRNIQRRQVCITLPEDLWHDVDAELEELRKAYERTGQPMPGPGGKMPQQRKSVDTDIPLSEIVERLLSDWLAAMQDIKAGKRPQKIGVDLRPPRSITTNQEPGV